MIFEIFSRVVVFVGANCRTSCRLVVIEENSKRGNLKKNIRVGAKLDRVYGEKFIQKQQVVNFEFPE